MPATYAHIALVNTLSEINRLEAAGIPASVIEAVSVHLKFCELGAVSPDYPYLALGDKNANLWADYMHYDQTVEMIRAGVRHLRGRDGDAWLKGTAWLLGYAAHVATDVAIHPVVKLRVGPYFANSTGHRVCEMHQDAYIWPRRMNLGEVGASEYLTSGIGTCGDPTDGSRLDPHVESLWRAMLRDAHPDAYAANTPDIHNWHRSFRLVVDRIAEEGGHLVPLARHVAADLGLVYPAQAEIDSSYITNLRVPSGDARHYEWIFDWAVEKVLGMWQLIVRAAVDSDSSALDCLPNWNLDLGCQETSVYWS